MSDMNRPGKLDAAAPEGGARRGFLGVAAAAVGGTLLASGARLFDVQAATPTAGADASVRWGLLIDSEKCASGCTDCVTACHTENGIAAPQKPTDVQWIRKVELKQASTGRSARLPVMCQHCADPPCVDVCPTGASFKRADGIVMVDRHTCIGCRYCVMACPYQARSFVHEDVTDQKPDIPRGKGTVESCTLCVHRLDQGQQTTACADACTRAGHNAILFGNLNDPESEISRRARAAATTQLRADLRLDLGVRYQGL